MLCQDVGGCKLFSIYTQWIPGSDEGKQLVRFHQVYMVWNLISVVFIFFF